MDAYIDKTKLVSVSESEFFRGLKRCNPTRDAWANGERYIDVDGEIVAFHGIQPDTYWLRPGITDLVWTTIKFDAR